MWVCVVGVYRGGGTGGGEGGGGGRKTLKP